MVMDTLVSSMMGTPFWEELGRVKGSISFFLRVFSGYLSVTLVFPLDHRTEV